MMQMRKLNHWILERYGTVRLGVAGQGWVWCGFFFQKRGSYGLWLGEVRRGWVRFGWAGPGLRLINNLHKESEMNARNYAVEITGASPLLMHSDNLPWAETMKLWEKDPANSKGSVKGDDRSPAWRWLGNAYIDLQGNLCVPADNLMSTIRNGGARCPTGKGKGTFKSQSQSGLIVNEASWPIISPKGLINIKPFQDMATAEEADFSKYEETAKEAGFMLFTKRAKIGENKHVRVRPRIDTWSASGSILVVDEMITTDVLENILKFAGTYSGIGDWRPSSPKAPGAFGKFTVIVKEIK